MIKRACWPAILFAACSGPSSKPASPHITVIDPPKDSD
jgi:hypothetical protein